MSEWKTYRLGEIATFKYGKLPPKNSNIGQYPVWSGYRYVGYASTFNCPKNSIIVIARGVGGTGDVKIAKEDCFLTNLSIKVNIDTSICNPYYFYYQYLLSNLKYLDSGSAQSQITIEDLKRLNIKLPSLILQNRTVGILKSFDDKIELNRRINANLEAQAQALFRSWFVDNETNDLTYYELGDVTTITAGGDKPAVYSKDLTEQCCIPIYSNGIDNEGLYGYTNSAKINTASITISARGTIGYVCLRTKPYVPIVRLISVVPNKSELSAEFLYLWALTQNISGTGTTQQQLTVPDFRKTSIGLPPEETLKRFNDIIIPIFQKIDTNKNENKTLSALRDTLLPKLMAGEIKIN